jgi:hypothetical protein
MKQQDNFENDAAAEVLADLPLANEQAEATKAGSDAGDSQIKTKASPKLFLACATGSY